MSNFLNSDLSWVGVRITSSQEEEVY